MPGECWRFTQDVGVSESDASSPDPLFPVVRAWGELENLLEIGELILRSTLFREESRGGHYRLDFPTTDAAWRRHTLVEGDRQFQSEVVRDP